MKETKEIRNVKKYEEKVFTKTKSKGYNNLKVKPLISKLLIKLTNFSRLNSCNRCIYEREGLYMEETKVILEEIGKELNFRERILVKIFRKTFVKVYRLGMISCFKFYNK